MGVSDGITAEVPDSDWGGLRVGEFHAVIVKDALRVGRLAVRVSDGLLVEETLFRALRVSEGDTEALGDSDGLAVLEVDGVVRRKGVGVGGRLTPCEALTEAKLERVPVPPPTRPPPQGLLDPVLEGDLEREGEGVCVVERVEFALDEPPPPLPPALLKV